LPIIIIPIILLTFKHSSARGYWYLLCAYVIAKVFEHFDTQIFEFLGFVSGHSIKHIIAALGLLAFCLVKRKK
jgi:hypothetical protein